MSLDPQARAVLDQVAAAGMPDMSQLAPREARKLVEVAQPPGEDVARVEDRSLPGPAGDIPVRLYVPEGAGPLPTVAYFHGGGFVICGLDTHDRLCRSLANASGCALVSVDYRLAPEHPFPAAPEDCYAVTRWLSEKGSELGVDGGRLAVAGDSAGGNLAAVVALMARDRGGPTLRHQLLAYPVTDHSFDTDSYSQDHRGQLLTRAMMEYFWRHYLERDSDGANPYASPLRAPDLGGLPPAQVLTAGHDPLRDEGDAYARRLREAGVPVTHRRYDGLFHGFLGMGDVVDVAREAHSEAARELRAALTG